MRILSIILLSIALVSCMETDARVIQLENEKEQLELEIIQLVDSVEVKLNEKNLQIINLNAIIQAKDNSFDSLMVILNNNLSDTTYLDSLRNRLVRLINEN